MSWANFQHCPSNDEAIREFHPGPDSDGPGSPVATLWDLETELLEIAIKEGLREVSFWSPTNRKRELALRIIARRGG